MACMENQRPVLPLICMLWLLLKALDRNWLLWDTLTSENQFIISLFYRISRDISVLFLSHSDSNIQMHSIFSASHLPSCGPLGKGQDLLFPRLHLPQTLPIYHDFRLYSQLPFFNLESNPTIKSNMKVFS